MKSIVSIEEPPIARFMFADSRASWIWLLIRVYVGWQWLAAGWAKFGVAAWTGSAKGAALSGFLNGALQKTSGAHADVSGWYAWFITNIALPNSELLSLCVVYGEILVGLALILGAFTGIAAFFGAFMNFNYLFAGTVSINPLLVFLQLFLILGWRIAGWIGFDRFLLPFLGTPWQPGESFQKPDTEQRKKIK